MGLSTSAGINIFLNQVVAEKGLPFTPTIDKKKFAEKWDKEVALALKHAKRYKDAHEHLSDL